jgi:uncharacterized integral membrane protein (TIGR00697 family)
MDVMLYNSLWFFVSLAVYFAAVVIGYAVFGKMFLFVWTSVSVVIANIEVLIQADMFGIGQSLGNAVYASTFVALAILTENHGKSDAVRAVNVGLMVNIVWLIATQIMIRFVPNIEDFAMPMYTEIFGIMWRVTLASLFAYVVSHRIDIWMYHLVWKLTGGNDKWLWLRNAGTVVSQFVDNTAFTFIAFWGVFDIEYVFGLWIATFIIKMITTLTDTPTIYLARWLGRKLGYSEEVKA